MDQYYRLIFLIVSSCRHYFSSVWKIETQSVWCDMSAFFTVANQQVETLVEIHETCGVYRSYVGTYFSMYDLYYVVLVQLSICSVSVRFIQSYFAFDRHIIDTDSSVHLSAPNLQFQFLSKRKSTVITPRCYFDTSHLNTSHIVEKIKDQTILNRLFFILTLTHTFLIKNNPLPVTIVNAFYQFNTF